MSRIEDQQVSYSLTERSVFRVLSWALKYKAAGARHFHKNSNGSNAVLKLGLIGYQQLDDKVQTIWSTTAWCLEQAAAFLRVIPYQTDNVCIRLPACVQHLWKLMKVILCWSYRWCCQCAVAKITTEYVVQLQHCYIQCCHTNVMLKYLHSNQHQWQRRTFQGACAWLKFASLC